MSHALNCSQHFPSVPLEVSVASLNLHHHHLCSSHPPPQNWSGGCDNFSAAQALHSGSTVRVLFMTVQHPWTVHYLTNPLGTSLRPSESPSPQSHQSPPKVKCLPEWPPGPRSTCLAGTLPLPPRLLQARWNFRFPGLPPLQGDLSRQSQQDLTIPLGLSGLTEILPHHCSQPTKRAKVNWQGHSSTPPTGSRQNDKTPTFSMFVPVAGIKVTVDN